MIHCRPSFRSLAGCGSYCRVRRCTRVYSSLPRSYHDADLYDIVCVGGGPAGLSLANALRSSEATSRLRIAIIDSQDLTTERLENNTSYSNRCSSLTPTTVNFLKDIGAWAHVNHTRIHPFYAMKVWDGVTNARIEFDWMQGKRERLSDEHDLFRPVAYMTENVNLTSALVRRIRELGDVKIYDRTKVENITLGSDNSRDANLTGWPFVQLSTGEKVAARLLVGADGFNSPVRSFAGIDSRGWDYDRHGVVATLRMQRGTDNSQLPAAYQRFLPTGPVALLPLPGNLATLVWSTLPAHATLLKRLANESPDDLLAMVNAAFRLSPIDLQFMHTMHGGGQADELLWRLEHTTVDTELVPAKVESIQEGSVASFPLRMRHADRYIGERVALVGDAAHTIHPLAGQGLNQGQADIQSLFHTIAAAASTGQDIGTQLSLESYSAERYPANYLLLGVVDKLHKLYSVQSGPLVPLRSWGLKAVEAMPLLKEFFMKQASGSGG